MFSLGLYSHSPLCLFFFALMWIVMVVLGRKRLMDSQRCIHDMVMRFKFVRHFWPEKKRLLFARLCPIFFFYFFLQLKNAVSQSLLPSLMTFLNVRDGDTKLKKHVKMWKQLRKILICHLLPKQDLALGHWQDALYYYCCTGRFEDFERTPHTCK